MRRHSAILLALAIAVGCGDAGESEDAERLDGGDGPSASASEVPEPNPTNGDPSVEPSADPNVDPYCCTLRTLCSECVCEPDVIQIGHNGNDAACERYLDTGAYGCADFDEGDAVVACESGRGVAIDDERLTCAANDELFLCECALGSAPPAHLDIAVGLCDETTFSPRTLCCVPAEPVVSDCSCAGVVCTDDGSECRCGTNGGSTGIETCPSLGYSYCCLQADSGDCVCSEQPCGGQDLRVASCSIYRTTCAWTSSSSATQVSSCSEQEIINARSGPVITPELPGVPFSPECGNGVVETGEECDDRNSTPNDGCEPDCVVTEGPYCGNGVVEDGEECDDGQAVSERCGGCVVTGSCGDGIAEGPEECDDGNNAAGDGCENNCTLTLAPTCGDGVVDQGEGCDDGNAVPGDGCSPDCKSEATPRPIECGNGMVEAGERCDDGNNAPGDGCENDCTLTLAPTCGDSVLDQGEECDDGNQTAGDGCETNCTLTILCGNGVVQGSEGCDDGNNVSGDGCAPDCTTDAAF